MDTYNSRQAKLAIPVLPTVIAVIALVLAIAAFLRRPSAPTGYQRTTPGILIKMSRTKELHAGYGVYPPYTEEDPNTHKVTGFSVEIIEHIAKELGYKVVWHRLSWDTMSADIKRGEYDVIADPIFETIPRAPEFAFSSPYALFPDGIVVVRIDEHRFNKLDDLDRKGLTVSVGLGQASESLVKARFSKATISSVSVGTDNMQIFNGVLTGRADAAVADAPNAKKFVSEHPGKVKAIGLEAPPAYMPAGFALRPDDPDGAQFFSVCIRYMRNTGIIDALARKYQLPSKMPKEQ